MIYQNRKFFTVCKINFIIHKTLLKAYLKLDFCTEIRSTCLLPVDKLKSILPKAQIIKNFNSFISLVCLKFNPITVCLNLVSIIIKEMQKI